MYVTAEKRPGGRQRCAERRRRWPSASSRSAWSRSKDASDRRIAEDRRAGVRGAVHRLPRDRRRSARRSSAMPRAWGPRIKTGFDALLHSALAGKGAMPPQGGGDFSDLEIGRAVVYMANKAGAKFDGAEGGPPATRRRSGGDGRAAAPAAAAGRGRRRRRRPRCARQRAADRRRAADRAAADAPPARAPALYTQVCQACHAAGVAGAPKFGDKAAWAPRIAQGIDGADRERDQGQGRDAAEGRLDRQRRRDQGRRHLHGERVEVDGAPRRSSRPRAGFFMRALAAAGGRAQPIAEALGSRSKRDLARLPGAALDARRRRPPCRACGRCRGRGRWRGRAGPRSSSQRARERAGAPVWLAIDGAARRPALQPPDPRRGLELDVDALRPVLEEPARRRRRARSCGR